MTVAYKRLYIHNVFVMVLYIFTYTKSSRDKPSSILEGEKKSFSLSFVDIIPKKGNVTTGGYLRERLFVLE